MQSHIFTIVIEEMEPKAKTCVQFLHFRDVRIPFNLIETRRTLQFVPRWQIMGHSFAQLEYLPADDDLTVSFHEHEEH